MKRSIIESVLIAAALLLCASMSLAAENKPGDSGETISVPKTTDKSVKAKDAKAAAKVKLVDINSAGKTELKKLPGIDEAMADKIIAGRPYLSKANLVTRNVIPHGIYEQIKNRIIAIQKSATTKK